MFRKIQIEWCELICNTGFVAKKYRKLKTDIIISILEWDYNDIECVESVLYLLGNGESNKEPLAKLTDGEKIKQLPLEKDNTVKIQGNFNIMFDVCLR